MVSMLCAIAVSFLVGSICRWRGFADAGGEYSQKKGWETNFMYLVAYKLYHGLGKP